MSALKRRGEQVARRDRRELMPSLFGEVEVIPPTYGFEGYWIIPEWGFIDPNPLQWGGPVITGWYVMRDDSTGTRAVNVPGSYGGSFYGGGPAIGRLVEGKPQPDDCEPLAWGPPPDSESIRALYRNLDDETELLRIDSELKRWLCEIVTVWLDPATTCLPEEIRRCLAENWKRTRVILTSAPCVTRGTQYIGFHMPDPDSPDDRHYLVLCQPRLNEQLENVRLPSLWEVVLHEMLHACGCGEFEAQAITAYCLGPSQTRYGSAPYGNPEHGISFRAVAQKLDQDRQRGWFNWDPTTRKWYGQWIIWDCDKGEVWLNVNNELKKIFPDESAGTGEAKPGPFEWLWGIFDRCPDPD